MRWSWKGFQQDLEALLEEAKEQPVTNSWMESYLAVLEELLKAFEEKLTAELKAHKEKENMHNTYKPMDFSALVETVNKGTAVMQKTPMFVEYLGSTWRLNGLKLEIPTSGSHKLSMTLEPVDVSRSWLIAVLDASGLSFSGPQTS